MKAFFVIFIIVIVIVVGWIVTFNSIEKDTEEFMNNLNALSTEIEAERWDIANAQFSEIEENWNKIRGMWSTILDHHEIDNIDLSMAKTLKYVYSENPSLALGEIEVLKKLFGIVKENEALTLTNIF